LIEEVERNKDLRITRTVFSSFRYPWRDEIYLFPSLKSALVDERSARAPPSIPA